jgi:hypothetical protein
VLVLLTIVTVVVGETPAASGLAARDINGVTAMAIRTVVKIAKPKTAFRL